MKNLLLLIAAALFLSSCDPLRKECKDTTGNGVLGFLFDIPYTVIPSKDTFKVGDTIWIESTFSNQMYNQRNGKTYSVNDFNFKMYGFISDLKTNPCVATNAFTMVNSNGQVYNTDRDGVYYYFNFKMQDGYYKWKAGFIMTQSGLYDLIMGSDIGLGNIGSQSPSQHITECGSESVNLDFTRSNGSANTYLLYDAADPYVREPGDFPGFEKAGFAFYVKP